MNYDKKDSGSKSFDFAPDLTPPAADLPVSNENLKDTKSAKTSVNFDKDTSLRLKNLKENGVNVSHYVNKVVAERLKLENELQKDVYKKSPNDFVKVELLLHKDVAALLQWLELNRGAIPLANKLAEVIANDKHTQGQFLRGDCAVYGGNTLEIALDVIRRAVARLK